MIRLLVKNRLLALFGAMVSRGRRGEVKSAPVWKKVATALLILALAAFFVWSVTMMLIGVAGILVSIGGDWLYYSIITLITLAITVVLSIFETKSELFECKDNELLLSMPIKSSDILASRILVVLIYNYLIDAVFMIPAIVIYGVYSHNLLGILGGILVYLFVVPLGVSFASAVGFLVAKISKLFKDKTVITMVFAIAFLVAYFLGYNYLIEGMQNFLSDVSQRLDTFKSEVPALAFIGSIALLDPLPTVTFVLASVIFALVAFFVISANYTGLITNANKGTRVKYTEKKLSSSSALFAIVKKEFLRFASSATYMLNAGIGFVMPIVISVFALVKMGELQGFFVNTGDLLTPFVAVVSVALSSMGFMSACTLSLEGSAFWIMKSMPISARTIILGKTLPQIIISVPVSIITGVCLTIAAGTSPIYLAFIIPIGIFTSVAFAFIGIMFNAIFPRFDFTSEAHVVKQSLASMLAMFSQMAIAIAFFPLVIWFLSLEFSALLSLGIMLGISVLLAVTFAVVALVPCAEKIEKMNV